ncbi:nitrite reductase large subunit NirB [Massilia sp. W12]|uniref:nitrite reductase large subunit NirB n=1 Tax=Massilia sp. W12 TaxID=3126507 RepID=UPI0030D48CA6
MQKQKLVLVGNGMAGVRTLEELLALAPDRYEITVFGAEPHPNYNRIQLSPVLAGEKSLDEIIINDWDWYKQHGLTLHTGCKVQQIARHAKHVIDEQGRVTPYDKLILATGSQAFMLPLPGADLSGVQAYRDIADTERMIAAAAQYKQAVVIGGGLLGLEAANGLRNRGMEVSVVHLPDWLMERQLDADAARLLQAELEQRGIRFLLKRQSAALLGDEDGRVRALRFADGEEVAAQLVVMAVGIRPDEALAKSAGLECARGVVVNDVLQTSDPDIYAVGECANHRGTAYGLVAPLYDMAKVCARHLADQDGAFAAVQLSTRLKVTGVDLFSAGDFMGGEGSEEIILRDAAAGVYKRLVLRDERLVGACLYGDTADAAWYLRLMKEQAPIADVRPYLMFGEQAGQAQGGQADPIAAAAAMPDQAEVCGCNGVCKGQIVEVIKQRGLHSLEEVRKHSKASASCGSCSGLVQNILCATLGQSAAAPKRKSLCGCTSLGHGEVREAIVQQKLLSLSQVMQTLGWSTPSGCATCRPALNYYLISSWPHEAKDDPQSRAINERAHANIQKDGRYSVVPRMWGGMTSSAQLRKIADVVDQFQIPAVKVTGGQRIDLLGVRKADLPAVWQALDMPSGAAYAKGLRTVKTCVGSEWCRFGTQDSTAMGQQLEHTLNLMSAPHKVKLAVSGCPRNCAEAGIKDVGVVGVDSGWEIYIGGNGGIKTEVAQLLVKVKSAQEVMEYSGAFLQLYREQGWYLERTVHYLARVGLEFIKQQVVQDAANRAALYARLLYALEGAADPWLQPEQAGVDLRQFNSLQGTEVEYAKLA